MRRTSMHERVRVRTVILALCVGSACTTPQKPPDVSRDCNGFANAVRALPTVPDVVHTAKRERFLQDIGRTWCIDASAFDRTTADDSLAASLKFVAAVGNNRTARLSPDKRAEYERIAALAEQHICPDWRTIKFAVLDIDQKRPQLKCEQ